MVNPRNNRKEWSTEDKKALKSLYRDKTTALNVSNIAKRLKRSTYATIKQASRLGITHWSK